MTIIPRHTKNIKIRIWDDNQPVFKAKGEETEVKKKLAGFFKFK